MSCNTLYWSNVGKMMRYEWNKIQGFGAVLFWAGSGSRNFPSDLAPAADPVSLKKFKIFSSTVSKMSVQFFLYLLR